MNYKELQKMKSVKFSSIRQSQRFWADAFDGPLVEHIRLYEPVESEKEVQWNCVELSEGRLGLILDDIEVLINESEPIVKNVKQCSLCQGIVDRFEHCFQCRDCTAIGDLFTGIMTRMDREYYEKEFGDKNVPSV